MKSVQIESGNGETSSESSDVNSLPLAARFFPTLSEFLRSAEVCPECVRQWVGMSHDRIARFQELLFQWQAAGRPELKWHEPEALLSLPLSKLNGEHLQNRACSDFLPESCT